jgi:hypothetical protein
MAIWSLGQVNTRILFERIDDVVNFFDKSFPSPLLSHSATLFMFIFFAAVSSFLLRPLVASKFRHFICAKPSRCTWHAHLLMFDVHPAAEVAANALLPTL